jgi:hypothetical protein
LTQRVRAVNLVDDDGPSVRIQTAKRDFTNLPRTMNQRKVGIS